MNLFPHADWLRGFAGLVLCAALLSNSSAQTGPDKYALKVPGGLAFSEFRGYESWETISLSHSATLIAVIVGNPAMIDAYKTGIPGNGKPFPDGARMAKIHWTPTKNMAAPGQPTVAGPLHDVDFMVKDSKRFADGGGWGYAAFKYDAAANAYTPGTTGDSPPQANDAKCGVACHTIVKTRDYVFTEYAKR
jgi:Cytochrome P460